MTCPQEIGAPRSFATDYYRLHAYMCEAADHTQGVDAYWRDVDRQIHEAYPISYRAGANMGINAQNARRARDLKAYAREIQAEHERACRAPRGGVDLSRIGGC